MAGGVSVSAAQCQPGHDAEDLEWEEWDPSQTTFIQHMIAGSIAGLAEHTCMFPVDTLKTHIQCERCGSANPVNTLRYVESSVRGEVCYDAPSDQELKDVCLCRCAKRIIRREGV